MSEDFATRLEFLEDRSEEHERNLGELSGLTARLNDDVETLTEQVKRSALEAKDFREESRLQNRELRDEVIKCIADLGEKFADKLDDVKQSVPEEFWRTREIERSVIDEERKKDAARVNRLIYLWTAIAAIGTVAGSVVAWMSLFHG